VLEHCLLVLGVVVLRVLGDVAELAGDTDAIRHLAPLLVPQVIDLLLELLVALGRQDDFLQAASLGIHTAGLARPKRGGMVAAASSAPQGRGYDLQPI
jgi:hypothetical protein